MHVDIYGTTKAISKPTTAPSPTAPQERTWWEWAVQYVPGASAAQSVVEVGEETRQSLLDTAQGAADRAAEAAERTARVVRITTLVLTTVTAGSIVFAVWSRHQARMARAKARAKK